MDIMDTHTVAKPREVIKPPTGRYVRLSAVLPVDLYNRFSRVARQLDRPMAWIARAALTEWLDRHQAGGTQ